MKKLGIIAAAALAFAAAPANAAPFLQFDGISGVFGFTEIGSGSFAHEFTFETGTGIVGATITSIAVSSLTDVDFTSVTLNGVPFVNQVSDGPGIGAEFRSLQSLNVTTGTQLLRVEGTSGGDGEYDGVIAFTARQVPEPAGWTTMVLALGLLGGALKLSRRQSRKAAAA